MNFFCLYIKVNTYHISICIRILCLMKEKFLWNPSWQRNKFSIGLFAMQVYSPIFRLLFTIVEVIFSYTWFLKKHSLEYVICWSGKTIYTCFNIYIIVTQHHWWPFFVPLLGMGVPFFTWRKEFFWIFLYYRGEAKYLDENLLILQHAAI